MIFLVTNIYHFAKNKNPKQHGQGSFLENFQKVLSHLSKKVMKMQRFLEDLNKFLAFGGGEIIIFSQKVLVVC
jgi:hypothetical protein